jgi:hypothetical protein
MKNPEHDDPIILYRKINSVRESPEQTPPESAINPGIDQRIMDNLSNLRIEHPKKFPCDFASYHVLPDRISSSTSGTKHSV